MAKKTATDIHEEIYAHGRHWRYWQRYNSTGAGAEDAVNQFDRISRRGVSDLWTLGTPYIHSHVALTGYTCSFERVLPFFFSWSKRIEGLILVGQFCNVTRLNKLSQTCRLVTVAPAFMSCQCDQKIFEYLNTGIALVWW